MPDDPQEEIVNNFVKKVINIAIDTIVASLVIYFVFGVNLLTAFLDEGFGSIFQTVGSNIYLLLYIVLLVVVSVRAEAMVEAFRSSLRNWKSLLRIVVTILVVVLVYWFLLPPLEVGSLAPVYGLVVQFVIALLFR